MQGVPGGKPLSILIVLQPADGSHASIIKQQDAASGAVLGAIDQDLRVHREGTIPGQRQSVKWFGCHPGRQQGGNRKSHVGGSALGEGLPGLFILHHLEAVGLHIPGIEETNGSVLPCPLGRDHDGSRLAEYLFSPVFVA